MRSHTTSFSMYKMKEKEQVMSSHTTRFTLDSGMGMKEKERVVSSDTTRLWLDSGTGTIFYTPKRRSIKEGNRRKEFAKRI